MSKITQFNEAISQVMLKESVEDYHFQQAHAHNGMAKDCGDKALNHAVAAKTAVKDSHSGPSDEWLHHDALRKIYKQAAEHHSGLAVYHGKMHDSLKQSVKS